MKMLLRILGVVLLIVIVGATIFFFYARYRLKNVKDERNLQSSVAKAAAKQLQSGKTYGLVIGVYKGGRTYVRGYGTINREATSQPDSSTIMELASTSKLFTTSVLQILCDEGLLNLDDKISVLLKDKVALPANARNTTLRQLATHTSGFPSLPQSFIDKMTDESDPYKDLTTKDLYDYLKTCADKKADGQFEYSNLGMGLLGHIMELKTNKKFEDIVKEKLLSKLQMNNTFVTSDSAQLSKIALGYSEAGKPNVIWHDNVLTGAGSFLSNATDMLAFIKANLAKDNSLVSLSLLKTHAQQAGGETGLGWIQPSALDRFMGNKYVVWHNGIAGGYASFIALDTQNQCGIIILSNKAVDVTALGMKIISIVKSQSWKE